MKKFLIKASAGLFVLSLLVTPIVVLAGQHDLIDAPGTCRTRADLSPADVEALTGANVEIPGGTLLPDNPPGNATQEAQIESNFGIVCAFSLVSWISGILFLVIGILSVLVIAVSALYFLTAAGNEDRLKQAKAYLLYGAVGIAVAAVANLLPAIIRGFFT